MGGRCCPKSRHPSLQPLDRGSHPAASPRPPGSVGAGGSDTHPWVPRCGRRGQFIPLGVFWGGFGYFLSLPTTPSFFRRPLPPRRGPSRPMRTQSRRRRGLPRSAKPISPPSNPINPSICIKIYIKNCISVGYRILLQGEEVACHLPAAAGDRGFCVYIYLSLKKILFFNCFKI